MHAELPIPLIVRAVALCSIMHFHSYFWDSHLVLPSRSAAGISEDDGAGSPYHLQLDRYALHSQLLLLVALTECWHLFIIAALRIMIEYLHCSLFFLSQLNSDYWSWWSVGLSCFKMLCYYGIVYKHCVRFEENSLILMCVFYMIDNQVQTVCMPGKFAARQHCAGIWQMNKSVS